RWADDPVHADDTRWIHRPSMDWQLAAHRADAGSLEGVAYRAIRGLVEARRAQLALRGGGERVLLPSDNPHILAYRRRHRRDGPLVAVASFSDDPESAEATLLGDAGIHRPV